VNGNVSKFKVIAQPVNSMAISAIKFDFLYVSE